MTTTDDLAIGAYTYDGRNHRIKKVVTNSGDLDGSTYFYHNKKWQLLETRDGSENLDEQSIWGTQYIDELVRFEKQDYGTMIAYHDHNYNITSITNLAGDVLERISYTPYGQPTYDVATINGDYDADGDIDSSDNTNFSTCSSGGSGVPVSGACRVFDFDNDKDVDLTDYAQFQLKYTGSTEIYRKPASNVSGSNIVNAHQGLHRDIETAMYHNRRRQYMQAQIRFLQRDPKMKWRNLYTYLDAHPYFLDPSGKEGINPAKNLVEAIIDETVEEAFDLFFPSPGSGVLLPSVSLQVIVTDEACVQPGPMADPVTTSIQCCCGYATDLDVVSYELCFEELDPEKPIRFRQRDATVQRVCNDEGMVENHVISYGICPCNTAGLSGPPVDPPTDGPGWVEISCPSHMGFGTYDHYGATSSGAPHIVHQCQDDDD